MPLGASRPPSTMMRCPNSPANPCAPSSRRSSTIAPPPTPVPEREHDDVPMAAGGTRTVLADDGRRGVVDDADDALLVPERSAEQPPERSRTDADVGAVADAPVTIDEAGHAQPDRACAHRVRLRAPTSTSTTEAMSASASSTSDSRTHRRTDGDPRRRRALPAGASRRHRCRRRAVRSWHTSGCVRDRELEMVLQRLQREHHAGGSAGRPAPRDPRDARPCDVGWTRVVDDDALTALLQPPLDRGRAGDRGRRPEETVPAHPLVMPPSVGDDLEAQRSPDAGEDERMCRSPPARPRTARSSPDRAGRSGSRRATAATVEIGEDPVDDADRSTDEDGVGHVPVTSATNATMRSSSGSAS
jgi:hypothetical protein